jgi:hypothetical protein
MAERKPLNKVSISGRIFQHDLELKTVQNKDSANFGKEFIKGKLEIAVDEDGLNVIPVDYTYVSPTTKAGSPNNTFTILKKIVTGEYKSWKTDGKDGATMIEATPSLGLNDFYSKDNEMISAQINDGGFLKVITSLPEDITKRSAFEVDYLITKVKEVEEDPERNIPASVSVHGAVFNWRGEILPYTMNVLKPEGMNWFLNQDISATNPLYTKIWGYIDCTVRMVEQTTETAFGSPVVRKVPRGRKTWVLTDVASVPYEFGEEGVLTAEQVQEKMQERNVKLAAEKKRTEDYRANQGSGNSTPLPFDDAPTPVATNAAAFNF